MMDDIPINAGSAGRYFDPDSTAVPGNVHEYFENTLVFAAVGLLVLLIITRAASSRNISPRAIDSDGAQAVPAVPYWLPILGHIPNMAMNADGFLRRLRDKYTNGIFALNFGGSTHNIIYTHGLATALLNQKQSVANSEEVARKICNTVFGFPRSEFDKYDAVLPDLLTCYKHLLSEPSLGDLVEKTTRAVKESIKDLVTGNDSPVDQMPWEKTSSVDMAVNKAGEPVVEASLLLLIRDYAAHTASPSIMGSDFLANFPDFFEDIWTLEKAWLLLAAGLPRWVPIPSVTRAYIARRRLLDRLYTFHEALEKQANGEDPGPKWSSLEDVGPLVKARMVAYRKHGISLHGRAAIEHSLLWAANVNTDTLISWMINRIYADKALLEMVREEIAPYVTVVEPGSDFLIPEPPRIERFDVEGLCSSCPLLESCYIECLRLDAASWSSKVIKEDFVLQAREKDGQGWLLRKGEYAHVAHDLHNTDPTCFEDPMVWRADRHIKSEGDGKHRTAEMGTIRPYGGGSSLCKGRNLAFRELLLYTAAIVAMWDFEPAGGGPWKMPRHKKSLGAYTTNDDTRVWVKRRPLARLSEQGK